MDICREHTQLEPVPVNGDIVDEATVRKVFAAHRPHRVFHAAAYNHVPLMECNPEQAIQNNALRTRLVGGRLTPLFTQYPSYWNRAC
jgi:FlaA1/EpsC-like NDP-sugar epimerase